MTKEDAFNILGKHLGKTLNLNCIPGGAFYLFDIRRVTIMRNDADFSNLVSVGDTLLEAIENLPKEYRL